MTNQSGQYVSFGQEGDSDFRVKLPDKRTLFLEIKREGYDPSKLRGKVRERFAKQLAKLQEANARGDAGVWIDNGPALVEVIKVLLDGGRVEEAENGELRLIPRGGRIRDAQNHHLDQGRGGRRSLPRLPGPLEPFRR